MIFKARKEVNVLPSNLEPDTIYLVRTGGGFDLYCSDATGAIAHKINAPETLDISNIDNLQSTLDLKAPLASPTFTGQLILPNNSRINNTEHFYQTTKPVTRGNGSSLVVGDKWCNTATGAEWFWNGTYWLSNQLFPFSSFFANYVSSFVFNNTTSTVTYSIFPSVKADNTRGILWESISFFYRAGPNLVCDGILEIYANGLLTRTIQLSDFRRPFDGTRALTYSINYVSFRPSTANANDINYYILVKNVTSSISFFRGATTSFFREVLV